MPTEHPQMEHPEYESPSVVDIGRLTDLTALIPKRGATPDGPGFGPAVTS